MNWNPEGIKVGDHLTRVMNGYKPGSRWSWDAEVVGICGNTIFCEVIVDVPRYMSFDLATGISINGREYGWLERC